METQIDELKNFKDEIKMILSFIRNIKCDIKAHFHEVNVSYVVELIEWAKKEGFEVSSYVAERTDKSKYLSMNIDFIERGCRSIAIFSKDIKQDISDYESMITYYQAELEKQRHEIESFNNFQGEK